MTKILIRIIDWFYPPFRRIMPLQTFRYAACGGLNMVLGWLLYGVFERWIVAGRWLHLWFVTAAPHTVTLYAIAPINFAVGFLMNRNVAFTGSVLHARVQLVRYFLTWVGSLILDHLFLKVFVEVCGLAPLVGQIASTLLVVVYSYFSQKYFTFKS